MLVRADLFSLDYDEFITMPSEQLSKEVLGVWTSSGAQWADGMKSAAERIVKQYGGVSGANVDAIARPPIKDREKYCNDRRDNWYRLIALLKGQPVIPVLKIEDGNVVPLARALAPRWTAGDRDHHARAGRTGSDPPHSRRRVA